MKPTYYPWTPEQFNHFHVIIPTEALIDDEEFPDDALSNHTDMVSNEPVVNEEKRKFIRYTQKCTESTLAEVWKFTEPLFPAS